MASSLPSVERLYSKSSCAFGEVAASSFLGFSILFRMRCDAHRWFCVATCLFGIHVCSLLFRLALGDLPASGLFESLVRGHCGISLGPSLCCSSADGSTRSLLVVVAAVRVKVVIVT